MSATCKRPAKLDADCCWVAVAQVHRSDGHGPGETTWACEYLMNCSTESIAKDAAVAWFEETDQSEACEVTFSVERGDTGAIVEHRVMVGPEIVARMVRRQERVAGGAA